MHWNFCKKITSNDVSKLIIGQAQYSCIPNKKGGIIDDLIIYRLGEMEYFLVVNAANIEKDWNWIVQENTMGAELIDESDHIGLVAVQGPNAAEVLQNLTDTDLSEIKFYHFVQGTIAGIDNAIISGTGYTGSGGFEIYVKDGDLPKLWDHILKVGKGLGIKPCGLGARDTLRLEKGYCLYGNDITDETSPIEAGLSWITKIKKASDFNSKEIFEKQKKEGVSRKLVGFKMKDRRVPRNGYEILNLDHEPIGFVTSGTQSPILNVPIGLGYVQNAYSKSETEIIISTGRKNLSAIICKLPFV